MKVGLIYTRTTPELITDVEREMKTQLGEKVEFYSLQDSSILDDIQKTGYVTTAPAARLVGMYMKAAEAGCDAIINLCSSVGEVADAAQNLAHYIGIPIVRVDEEMCREAVRLGRRIGVMATLPTTLEPTKNTIKRVAREMNREVAIVECLIDGMFGSDQKQFKEIISKKINSIFNQVDVIVLSQGSMAYVAPELSEQFGKPVLGSPPFGVKALKEALIIKGVIEN